MSPEHRIASYLIVLAVGLHALGCESPLVASEDFVYLLATDDDAYYYSVWVPGAGSTIYRGTFDGQPPRSLATAQYVYSALLHEDVLYVCDFGDLGTRYVRIPTTGGEPEDLTWRAHAGTLATDGRILYIGSYEGVAALDLETRALSAIGNEDSEFEMVLVGRRLIRETGMGLAAFDLDTGATSAVLLTEMPPSPIPGAELVTRVEIVGELASEVLVTVIVFSLHETGERYEEGEPVLAPRLELARLRAVAFDADGNAASRLVLDDVVAAAVGNGEIRAVRSGGAVVRVDGATGQAESVGSSIPFSASALYDGQLLLSSREHLVYPADLHRIFGLALN